MSSSIHFSRIRAQEVSPLRTCLALAACDLLVLLVCFGLCWGLRAVTGGYVPLALYGAYWPFLPFFLIAYGAFSLYPGFALPPHLEIKKSVLATTFVVFVLLTTVFFTRGSEELSRAVILGFWFLAVIGVPMARLTLRRILSWRPWWGVPVVVFGRCGACFDTALNLAVAKSGGLVPVAMAADDLESAVGQTDAPFTVPDPLQPCRMREIHLPPLISEADGLALQSIGRKVAACIAPDADETSDMLFLRLKRLSRSFRVVLFPPTRRELTTLGLSVVEIGHRVIFRAEQKLLDPHRRMLKRAIDLFLVVTMAPLWLLLVLGVAVCIKLDSQGPIFYRHARIGRNGGRIRLWKFRSMIPDADAVLAEHLARDPALAREWELCHKIKDDPRITRVGRFLRATSLDELPQLFNVLVGDISLVGPRPIVESEIERYEGAYELYKMVYGGLTGLWQVSGRSDTTYGTRVALDEYYIRNWSIWLDLWILVKTPWAVLSRRGSC